MLPGPAQGRELPQAGEPPAELILTQCHSAARRWSKGREAALPFPPTAGANAPLRKYIKGMKPGIAEASYRVLLDPKMGLQRRAEMDVAGILVLAPRREFGVPRKALRDPMKYYDPTYYRKALAK